MNDHTSGTIAPHHRAALAASGITDEHAQARGYETISDTGKLAKLKIAKAARNTPGLLVPMLRGDGSPWGYQYRPDEPRINGNGKPNKYETPWKQPNHLDIPPGVGDMLGDPSIPLWITEGSKKADCGALRGLCIIALSGVWNWLGPNGSGGKTAVADFRDVALNGRRVIIAYDGDVARKPEVRKAATALAAYLESKGAHPEYLHLPDTDDKTGLDDYLMDGHTVDDLLTLVHLNPPGTEKDPLESVELPNRVEVQPIPLAKLHERFLYWFGEHYDLDAIDATLAAGAVERLDGDPLWLLIVAGPGWAKTETVGALRDCERVEVVSTITSTGALLSATSKSERAKDATGGLLKKLEPHGIMVLKDVTSILSLNVNMRAEVLAALREVYDGYWARNVGTDGGKTLTWKGRIAIVGAVTTAWDSHHAVVSMMGDRFVLLRVDSTQHRLDGALQAIDNTGREDKMRGELAKLAAGVLAGINTDIPALTDDEQRRIVSAANLVALARTAVDYDSRGEVINAHAPEAATRLSRQLTQLLRGAVAIGLSREDAMRLVIRCAKDSMPPLRLSIIKDVAANPGSALVDVHKRIDKPRTTVDRQLQALHYLGVLTMREAERMNNFGVKSGKVWEYLLVSHLNPAALDVA